ncbi:MAG: putative Serine/Threonine kinase domain protein [Streblomastix strix]|uniref:non-specific serine/threonine protein kinase n=1 Tax=Streblomastix strix TaxID=222440 RepID=A0A5J4VKU2_9EUKA|nr:MAG: putative Serine/Threonine kinase domain protein [Streblomastix strix]
MEKSVGLQLPVVASEKDGYSITCEKIIKPNQDVYIDKYRIIKQIGGGGSGKVYLVEERGTKFKTVMKRSEYKSDSQKQQIMYEIEIHKSLFSPFIVDFIDGFEYEEGTWNIIMEYCQGGDLDDFMEDLKEIGAEIDENRAWDLLSQMIMAVDYLHQNNILHRDLKPKNVFLSNTFDVRLGDFGISRVLADGEKYAHTKTGTVTFMCPELVSQGKFNEQGDVWGIGIIMYELLTGVLFTVINAQNSTQILQNIVNIQEPEITNYYSEGLRKLIHRMLIKDFHDRITIPLLKQEQEINKRMVLYANELIKRGIDTYDEKAKKYIMSIANMNKETSSIPLPCPEQTSLQFTQRAQLEDPIQFDIRYPHLACLDKKNPKIAIAQKDNSRITITISPEVCVGLGIVQCEVKFIDPKNRGYRLFGIVESNFDIPEKYFPGQDSHSLGYSGIDGILNRNNGSSELDACFQGNSTFKNDDIVKAEAIMNPNPNKRLIRFFVSGVEQPIYYTNIPSNFKFCIQRYHSQQAAEIINFRQVPYI